jgi:hypothetical protein
MAHRLDFDETNKIIRLSLEGAQTDQDVLDAQAALKACWDRCGPWNCIIDCTGVKDLPLLSETIRFIAHKAPIISADCSEIVVAPTDAEFGLARMFEAVGLETRPNMRVVRTMKEALDLIGVESPNFLPVAA